MKRMLVQSVQDAMTYVMRHYYPFGEAEKAERTDTYFVISIQDTHTQGFGFRFTENKFCKAVLTLYFDDITEETEGAVLFNADMAQQIIGFVRQNKDADTLLVHCSDGGSRSLAVGAALYELLSAGRKQYGDLEQKSPNMYIYDLLKSVWVSDQTAHDPSFDPYLLIKQERGRIMQARLLGKPVRMGYFRALAKAFQPIAEAMGYSDLCLDGTDTELWNSVTGFEDFLLRSSI